MNKTVYKVVHKVCRFESFKKEGLEKEIDIFEKKKEIRIKKEGSIFFSFLNKRRFSLI